MWKSRGRVKDFSVSEAASGHAGCSRSLHLQRVRALSLSRAHAAHLSPDAHPWDTAGVTRLSALLAGARRRLCWSLCGDQASISRSRKDYIP